MPQRDPRIDTYIAKAAAFAQPILRHIRKVVHQACPDVQETMKWSFPHFEHHGVLCSMAAFKQHCALGFWKGAQVLEGIGDPKADAMGQFGRITSIDDLPPARTLSRYVKRAAALNAEGIKRVTRDVKKRAPRKPVDVPADFAAALRKNREAAAVFVAFSPSQAREYVEWIVEAKREETRSRRIATAIEWIAQGKRRNWKYER